jgi:NAD(P)-dependent dehydrogenase (short-subunit alcohol dehydrogenase family)
VVTELISRVERLGRATVARLIRPAATGYPSAAGQSSRRCVVKIKLKPLDGQVVVVVGASSGIGRATASRLAGRGAKVVVAARSASGLDSLVAEIRARGGDAVSRVCDVADAVAVMAVADLAVTHYGQIDTWVNCAAQSLYASFEDTTANEFRRLMEVNYLGQVHGALAALPHLREAGQGALISISSVESIVSLPLHAAYSASKHAVEGAMDALRRDLIAEAVPISVTSIKPATVNTPLFTNSGNRMDVKPKGPPPIYSSDAVAACVEYAAEHPVRDLFAGGAAKQMAIGQVLMPSGMDWLLAKVLIRSERTGERVPGGSPGNLESPSSDDRVDGDLRGRPSVYGWLQRHPGVGRLALAGAVVGLAASAISQRDTDPGRFC